MILTGPRIEEEVRKGLIEIAPFHASQVNPNSYDLRLGKTLITYQNEVLDTSKENTTHSIVIPKEGIVLQPNRLYLGHSVERCGSDTYVPIIRGKSSTGRIGLFVHITADLIDIGHHGQITFMLHAVQPVRIYPNMRIGQITFWQTYGDVALYNGKYQNSIGPRPSHAYKEFSA